MKKIMLFCMVTLMPLTKAGAQTAEVTQLILNIEKLSQLRKILKELKEGYQILFKGYSTIKELSEGNFKLHQAFLDGLLEVSPAVKNYSRVHGIIQMQLAVIKEISQARARFAASGNFNAAELAYIDKVYDNMAASSLKNLDALTMVLTAKKLRASDDERLERIDQIHQDMTEKLSFVRHFNSNASVLGAQRENQVSDAKMLEELYQIQP